MVTYLLRSEWTSTVASGSALSGTKLRGVAAHWPGTTQDTIGDPGKEAIASRLRSYRDYHVNSKGWRDIGYNLAIDQGGRIWMLRSTQWRGNMVGAHCASATNQDANEEYVGVLLILGDMEQPSAKMISAFQHWYHDRFLPGWPNRTDVRGHRQVPGAQTNCPGDRAIALLDNGTFEKSPIQPPITTGDAMPTKQEVKEAFYEALVEFFDRPEIFPVGGNPAEDLRHLLGRQRNDINYIRKAVEAINARGEANV